MKVVAKLASLTELSLAYTRVSDAGAAELAKMKSLKSLNLEQTKVTKEVKDRLAKELPECSIEWSLSESK
jgi:hypothetical protein